MFIKEPWNEALTNIALRTRCEAHITSVNLTQVSSPTRRSFQDYIERHSVPCRKSTRDMRRRRRHQILYPEHFTTSSQFDYFSPTQVPISHSLGGPSLSTKQAFLKYFGLDLNRTQGHTKVQFRQKLNDAYSKTVTHSPFQKHSNCLLYL